MKKRGGCFFLTVLLLGVGAWAANSGPGPAEMRYKTSYSTIRKLGLDLYRGLKPKQREAISAEPVSVETDVTPSIKLAELTDDNRKLGFVFVSVGFIDLMNNVAHAKAIDLIERGYFKKYLQSLAQESGEKELRELPNLSNPKYWSDKVLNEQKSNFNQMVGTAVAIKLADYYLGHYKKYAAKLEEAKGKPVPINELLEPGEWEEAVRAGVANALEAGLGIEGTKALFDAIDEMPQRPGWTLYFLPANAKVKAIKKEMEKLEKKAFSGDL